MSLIDVRVSHRTQFESEYGEKVNQLIDDTTKYMQTCKDDPNNNTPQCATLHNRMSGTNNELSEMITSINTNNSSTDNTITELLDDISKIDTQKVSNDTKLVNAINTARDQLRTAESQTEYMKKRYRRHHMFTIIYGILLAAVIMGLAYLYVRAYNAENNTDLLGSMRASIGATMGASEGSAADFETGEDGLIEEEE